MAIGFDVGTYNLVCSKRNKNNEFEFKREVNAFIEFPLDPNNKFIFNMMKQAKVPLIERKDQNIAYALGESAVDIAYTMGQTELKRPMCDGCLNPKERNAQQIMNVMIQSLIGKVEKNGERLFYCVPSNAINDQTDSDYHTKVLEAMFKSFKDENGNGVTPVAINEALAIIYAELGEKAYTGMAVSCLCPGTKVYANGEIKNIEDVKIGDTVVTHKGRIKKVTNVITKHFKGKSTRFNISGYQNSIDNYQFVDNHELYVKRNGKFSWIGCEEIRIGDIVGEPILKENKIKYKMAEMTAKESLYENFSDKVLGAFLRCGIISDDKKTTFFKFESHEIDAFDATLKAVNSITSGSLTVEEDDFGRVIVCQDEDLTKFIYKNLYKNDKIDLDLSDFSDNQCTNILSFLLKLPDDNGLISFSTKDTRLLNIVRQLCSRANIVTTLTQYENQWEIILQDKDSMIDRLKNARNETSSQCFIEDGFLCGKVLSVRREQYEGVVYDLQVEGDHSFSGPMLTIHNCGAGMVNVCFAIYGKPIFQFAIVNSGDWIDKVSAKVTGESSTFINKQKTKVDLTQPYDDSLVMRAIKTQYEIMIAKTVSEIKKGLESAGNSCRTEKPIDIIVAGGTSSPNGFPELFEKTIQSANLPIQINKVIRPIEPLYSVAKGCLIAAEQST